MLQFQAELKYANRQAVRPIHLISGRLEPLYYDFFYDPLQSSVLAYLISYTLCPFMEFWRIHQSVHVYTFQFQYFCPKIFRCYF